MRILNKNPKPGKSPNLAELQTGVVNAEQIIRLRPGKNMVGICVDPQDRTTASIFLNRTVVYRFDPQKGYIPVKEMDPGEGYFVLSETDQMGSAVGPPVIKTQISVQPGA